MKKKDQSMKDVVMVIFCFVITYVNELYVYP